jgi:carboxymethylenebutenolidase
MPQITLTTPDGPMPAFEAVPDGAARGGVLVIQEAFGVTTHIEGIATRLAAEGWRAVAPALFHRQGSPVLDYGDMAAVMPVMLALTAEGLDQDISATLEHLEGTGLAPGQLGAVGFCMGGSVAFHVASSRAIGAAVTFYGGGVTEGRFGLPSLLDQAPALQTPWLGHFGAEDKGIPVEQVEQLREAVAATSQPTEVVIHPGAQHGFNCDDRPAVFHPEAAASAWASTLAWFDEHLHA